MVSAIKSFFFGPSVQVLENLKIDIRPSSEDNRSWEEMRNQIYRLNTERIKVKKTLTEHKITVDNVIEFSCPNQVDQILKKLKNSSRNWSLAFTLSVGVTTALLGFTVWHFVTRHIVVIFKITIVSAGVFALIAFTFLRRSRQMAALGKKLFLERQFENSNIIQLAQTCTLIRNNVFSNITIPNYLNLMVLSTISEEMKNKISMFFTSQEKKELINVYNGLLRKNISHENFKDLLSNFGIYVKFLDCINSPLSQFASQCLAFVEEKEALDEEAIRKIYQKNQPVDEASRKILRVSLRLSQYKLPDISLKSPGKISAVSKDDNKSVKIYHQKAIMVVINGFLTQAELENTSTIDFGEIYQKELIKNFTLESNMKKTIPSNKDFAPLMDALEKILVGGVLNSLNNSPKITPVSDNKE